MPALTRRSSLIGAGAVAGAVVCHVGAAAFFADHDPYATQLLPPCPILALTGWQCPGCGGVRALSSLLHGDLVGSFAMNPLLLALYATLALLLASAAVTRARPQLANRLALAALGVVSIAGLYSGVVRNLLA
jgi:hypothetical protein